MPEPTPERAGLKPPERALFPSQVLTRNLGAVRRLRGWRQQFVAERMMFLGHAWTPATVSEVERGRRNITVDELFSLALVFELTIERLLDARPDRLLFPNLKEPGRKVVLVRPHSGAASYAESSATHLLIDADNLHAVLCGHEINVSITWDDRGYLTGIEFHGKGEDQP